VAKATGARIVNNIDDLTPEDLGYAEVVEERKIEDDKFIFIEGCKNPRAVTILVRGGSERVVDEAERSLVDALNVVKEAERSLVDALNVVKDVILRPEPAGSGSGPTS